MKISRFSLVQVILASLAYHSSASSFEGDLKAIGAHAVFSGDSAYGGASEACKGYIFTKNGL